MSFTIRQLQFFVAVAEAGSVSGAARVLSISQSSVTEALKALETDLGVALFERRSRGLEITHRGSQFLRHATEILRGVSNARIAFREDAERRPGQPSLGVTSLVAGYVLSDLLSRFRRAYPEVEVRAIEDNGDYLQHLLVGGELDVAVLVTSRCGTGRPCMWRRCRCRLTGCGCRSGIPWRASSRLRSTRWQSSR